MEESVKRKETRRVMVGGVPVGGGSPVTVQSMTNTPTADVDRTAEQIERLTDAGCEIVRVAVPDMEAASALADIKVRMAVPLIADIHFDWRLAVKAVEAGVDGLRLNPGNIGSRERVSEVVRAARERRVPIRIGVNAGSLEKDLLEKYGRPTAEALVESALRHIHILEDLDYLEIKVSLKASSVPLTLDAYRKLSGEVDYPLHIGITEAGTTYSGTIKSAVGLGALLAEGIGDTLRVSLTGDPVDEVKVGFEILKALELRRRGVNVISCPTCGRIKLDAATIALEVERRLGHIKEPVNVAVMGCVVNGPGEATEADVGVAGGDGVGMVYVGGEAVRKVAEADLVDALVEAVEEIVEKRRTAGPGEPA